MLELARPLVNKPACLECHDTAADAPASMVALYGSQNGFGWKPGEVIGAQIVSVPMLDIVDARRADPATCLSSPSSSSWCCCSWR